jgi:hypothetical protein
MNSTNGDRELRPRFMPLREATKKVKGDVPESVADDFEQYCKFVAEAAGMKPEEVAGDVMAAALRDFLKADKSFPKWKEKQLEKGKQQLAGVSSDEVEEALSGLGAGAPQETPRPAERAASSSSASSSGGGAAASGGGRATTGRGSADAGRTTNAPPPPPPAARTPASPPAQT